jgi:hypothetical protein
MPTPQRDLGRALDVTVIALDPYGNTDTNYTGTRPQSSPNSLVKIASDLR